MIWYDKANIIHNNKYDYSKYKYINMKTKSVIICPDHGEFSQIMSSHLYSKAGCPSCGNILKSINQMMKSDEK